jgi:hypothetical protein
MEADIEQPLFRHGLQVPVEAVDHHELATLTLGGIHDEVRELARRHFGRIDLPDQYSALVYVLRQRHAQPVCAVYERVQPFIEEIERHVIAPIRGGACVLGSQDGLAAAGRPHDHRAGAAVEASSKQRIELLYPAEHGPRLEGSMMLGGNQPGKHIDSAGPDGVIVVSPAVKNTAHLYDAQLPALGAVVQGQLLQEQDAVRQAPELEVSLFTGTIINQEDGCAMVGEEVLESQNLPAVAEGISRQESKLRQRVEHNAHRLYPLDCLEDRLGRTGQLYFGRVEHGVLGVGLQRILIGHQFEDLDPIQGPAVRRRDHPELLGALGQRHVQALFVAAGSLEEELEGQGGLARTRVAFDQKQMLGGVATPHHAIEAGDTGEALLGRAVAGDSMLAKSVGHERRSSRSSQGA